MSKTKPPKTREMPNSPEAEQAVIGCCLRDGELEAGTIPLVASLIKPHYIYDAKLRSIYETILLLYECQQPVDIITTANQLENTDDFQEGDRSFLSQLADGVATVAKVRSYCSILKDKHSYRRLIDKSLEISNQAFAQVDLPKTIIENATGYYFDIASQTIDRGFTRVGDLLPNVMQNISDVQEGTKQWGLPTGYKDLDDLTGGFQKGNLVVIAARPSVGKTAFANCIGVNIAQDDHAVGVFSLESDAEEYSMRAMCTAAGVDSMHLKTGKVTEKDWLDMTTAMNTLSELKYYVESPHEMGINQIIAKAIAARKEGRLDVLIIDYLQCIKRGAKETRKDTTDISTAQLKILAKRLGIPVVALCQINREIEKRRNKRPMLSDLKESGNIEQDADLVIGLFRPVMYVTKPEDKYREIGKAEAIVMKNRNGPIGTVDLHYEEKFTRFENLPQIEAAF